MSMRQVYRVKIGDIEMALFGNSKAARDYLKGIGPAGEIDIVPIFHCDPTGQPIVPETTSDTEQEPQIKLVRIHYCKDGSIMGIFKREKDYLVKFLYPSRSSLFATADTYEDAVLELSE